QIWLHSLFHLLLFRKPGELFHFPDDRFRDDVGAIAEDLPKHYKSWAELLERTAKPLTEVLTHQPWRAPLAPAACYWNG
ncbi:MAG: hypothetical protein R6V29_11685, partial [Spirochaetia bacterium]